MGTTLSNGVYLPDEGERNCYAGLKLNWETLDQKVADISALQSAIAGALHREIVASLPTTDIDTATIYMILSGTSATENVYDEYMYISNAWELIGTSATDLTNYYTKAEVDGKLLLKASASDLTSHTGDTTIHVTASDKAKWDTLALIKHLRLVNAQVGSATTIPFSDFDDTNGIKVGDKCADLDVKVFEITAVDTANQTVTVSPLLDIALDANVVHNAGNETVGGIKTFSDETYIKSLNFTNEVASPSSSSTAILPIIVTVTYTDQSQSQSARLNLRITADGVKSFYPHENLAYSLGLSSRMWSDFYTYHGYFRGQQQNDEYSPNARTNLTLLANRDTLGTSGIFFDSFRENTSQGTGSHILGVGIKENSVRYEGCRFSWFYDDVNNGYSFALRPTTQGTNQPIKYELGNSSSKWTTINGLNPGSLSLPDLNNGIDISGFITTGSSTNDSYTAPADGYLAIIMSSSSPCGMYVYDYSNGIFMRSNSITDSTYSNVCGVFIPILKTQTMNIASRVTESIVSAKFFPCLGNI